MRTMEETCSVTTKRVLVFYDLSQCIHNQHNKPSRKSAVSPRIQLSRVLIGGMRTALEGSFYALVLANIHRIM